MEQSEEDEDMMFIEEIKQSGGNEFTKYQIAVAEKIVYPNYDALNYLLLGLVSAVGEAADIQRRIVRRDFVNKGIHQFNATVDMIIASYAKMMFYTAELLNVCNENMGELVDCAVFIDFEDKFKPGKEGARVTPEFLTLVMVSDIGEMINEVSPSFTGKDKEVITEFCLSLISTICHLCILHDRPFDQAFDLDRVKIDTGED